jgi:hypothetical protein
MNSSNGVVVVLLAAILFVLLFGCEAFFSGLGIMFWIFIVIAVLSIMWAIIAAVAKEIRNEKVAGRAWVWQYLAYPSMAGNIVVFAIAAIIAWADGTRINVAIEKVPYWWVPITIFVASSFILQPMENLVVKWRRGYSRDR